MRAIPHTITEYASSDEARNHRGFVSAGDAIVVWVRGTAEDLTAIKAAVGDAIHVPDSDVLGWETQPVAEEGGINRAAITTAYTIAVNELSDLLHRVADSRRLPPESIVWFVYDQGDRSRQAKFHEVVA